MMFLHFENRTNAALAVHLAMLLDKEEREEWVIVKMLILWLLQWSPAGHMKKAE